MKMMTRQVFYNEIESRLSWLVTRIEIRGSMNILDLNIHSEDFYLHLLNAVFGWKLENLNKVQQNSPGIDLIDRTNKYIIQVSSTATKRKIESALSKKLDGYKGYEFKFIAISKNADGLRKMTYLNPHDLVFQPVTDIYDVKMILDYILSLDISEIEIIYKLVIKEIHIKPEITKVESNLASLIALIANEDWGKKIKYGVSCIPYDIERKIAFNKIGLSRVLIDDYKDYYSRIDQIYSEYDRQGNNKSFSVLNGFRSIYLENKVIEDPDELFSKIVSEVKDRIENSSNYVPIPIEELKMCVDIITVDAFIRCKIFENPEGYLNANT
jgi:hypothetical protein